jgi:Tol biopolymer transport system component
MDTTRHPGRRSQRTRQGAFALVSALAASTALVIAHPAPASAGALPVTTGLVSRNALGVPGAAPSEQPAISGDGRYVAFQSGATNLVAGDGNANPDIFVKDRWSQKTERVSVTSDGTEANGFSSMPSISDDGRYVAFRSKAKNLIPGDDKDLHDAFVRDRVAGTTIRVATGLGGSLLDNGIENIDISGNGRYVVFATSATNVVPNDTNGAVDIFVRDLQSSAVERVSVSALEGQGPANSSNPTISDDGRYVAFDSKSLFAGGTPGSSSIYVRDRTGGTTMLANVDSAENVDNAGAGNAAISGNGRYVAFGSSGTNLVANDTNGVADIFRRDLQAGVTIRASVSNDDAQLPLQNFNTAISDDGDAVSFLTRSQATTQPDAGSDDDLFVRHVGSGSTVRMSVGSVADPADSVYPGVALSDDGNTVAFGHPKALTGDNAAHQIYTNDRPALGPLVGSAAFIQQQFQDFLGRAATTAEEKDWGVRFNRGSATPPTLIATLAADPAFSGKRAPVVRLYWAFFLRKPDPSGLSYWITKFQNGTGLGAIAQKFAQSSEFKTRYGTLTNEQFVKLIYPNIFERQPDPSGLGYWTGKLDRKEITRGGVMIGFSESAEGIRRLAPQVNITLISQGMLGVSPAPAFWDSAFAVYKAGEKELAWLAWKTISSPEYDARIG